MRRLLIVEDHELCRDALAALLRDTLGMEVVGLCSNIRDARRLLAELSPDLILADLMLADGSATELVRFVRREGLKAKVLIVTGVEDAFAASDALSAGADGYLLKAQPVRDMMRAIETVSAGRRYVSPQIAPRLTTESVTLGAPVGLQRLSRRESEILRLLAQGHTSKEVAGRLSISTKTVETHRSNMNRKLRLRNTVELLRFAAANGVGIVAPQVPSPDHP